tara:strand:- start:123 stop:398 length:276 start_codon:yes stop_codon:yes gene_type:complete
MNGHSVRLTSKAVKAHRLHFNNQKSPIDIHQSIPTRLPSGENARHCTHFTGPLTMAGGGAAKDTTAKVRRLKERNSTEQLSGADTGWQAPG